MMYICMQNPSPPPTRVAVAGMVCGVERLRNPETTTHGARADRCGPVPPRAPSLRGGAREPRKSRV